MSGKFLETSQPSCGQPASLSLQEHSEASGDFQHDNYFFDKSTSDEDDGLWYPGDGVCPSMFQFDAAYQYSYNAWCSAVSRMRQSDTSKPLHIEAFLDMLQDVPSFFHNPPKDVDVKGGPKSPLTLRSSLRLVTTEDPVCEQSWKTIDYIQCLGFPTPMTYKSKSETSQPPPLTPGHASDQSGYLTSVSLAWSYIFSCRWVEILQQAGEKSSLWHDQGELTPASFWDLVTRSRWVAQTERSNGVFYAPWMLRDENSKIQRSSETVRVSPNSFLAYDLLVESCASKGLEVECILGLATILMLTSRNAPPPKLVTPIMISGPVRSSGSRDIRSERLFGSLDKCMAISSTQDALDSLLCSVFFDPCVPCNLVGAVSLSITKALLLVDGHYQSLVDAITDRAPQLAFFWAALVHNGQAMPVLTMALKDLPPICLVAAFWTNTLQSFLQVAYSSSDAMDTSIPRSCEFSTSYFCREASVPWTPAPPFGSTRTSNLSLEVKKHYRHKHRPVSWRSYWILHSGEPVPASPQYPLNALSVHSLQYGQNADPECWQQKIHLREQKIADEQSWSATSRLFNWHRYNEDGLWLDDGTIGKVEIIRKLQQHPWIVDPFDDGGQSDPLDEGKHTKLDRRSILEWTAKVEHD